MVLSRDPVTAVRRRAAIEPDEVQAWIGLSERAARSGSLTEAATYCARATAPAPDAAIFFHLGNLYFLLSDPKRAKTAFRRAIALQPAEIALLANGAEAVALVGDLHGAARLHLRALALRRNGAFSWANLAQILSRLDKAAPAVRCGRHAIILEPALGVAHVNTGLALNLLKRREEAETSFRRAMAIDPSSPDGPFSMAITRLSAGDFEKGFALYENRFRRRDLRGTLDRWPVPFWDGTVKKGLRLLLWTEQGFGDSIHFVRYAPLLARVGLDVTVVSSAPLQRLFRSLNPPVNVCSFDAFPDADAHAPLMSLPRLLGTRLENVPADVPYLRAEVVPPSSVRTAPFPRVGIAWAGRPEQHADRMRSLTADGIRRLCSALASCGAHLFSLQVGPRRDDLRHAWVSIVDLGGDFADFADTAAAISGLDLVISVDSSVAHLAGALGRPVWLMVSHVPEWRWLDTRIDNPWYPTFRLFRQPKESDWTSVFAEIEQEFAESFASRP